ncbi:MAG: ATPase, T2SS/T4P/T4SS family [Candidatus Odinarchaeota archaeon]
MSLKNLSYFKEKENLDGKKENVLILDCYKCYQKETNFLKSDYCIKCFLRILFNNRNQKFEYISIPSNDILITPNQFELFLDYFKILKKIKRIKSKIEKIRNQKCKYREFACKVLPNISSLSSIKDFDYLNPIFIYNNYNKIFLNLKKQGNIDSICQGCYNSIRISVKSLFRLLNDLKVIQRLKTFNLDTEINSSYHNFYQYFFSNPSLMLNNVQETRDKSLNKRNQLINSYNLGKPDIFKTIIFETEDEIENNYSVEFFFKGEPGEDYIEKIIHDIHNNIDIIELDQIVPVEKLIEIYEKEALKILKSKYKFSSITSKKIGYLTAIKKINLDKLFPLLIDDYIEEIFLDSPKDQIYINHQIYGRCRTNIRFNLKELERLKALIRLYSGQRLDFKNPSVKYVIKNKYFYCRFSIDVEPIQINNFALDIRKLNKNIFTIQDILKNGTIDPLIAAFLYFNILHRRNITITGETDTGKTTLINSLDLLTPKEFRKIYVENITESLNQIEYGKHQLKYKVDSLEDSIIDKFSKSTQIKTLLHRTPDIIYLGEILTKEEAEAMFHCLSAGLKGFQTIHSKNIDSLMNRFLYHFNIDKSCLSDLDILILMKKNNNKRKIVGVFEIVRSNDSKNKLFNSIFEYNPQSNKWVLAKSLYETNIILDIKKYENLTKELFFLLIELYREIFEFLLKTHKISNTELIEFFDKISYHSTISYDSVKQFWNIWKKNRSLNF